MSDTSQREEAFLQRTVKNVTSGTVAGIVVTLVGHPFDTLKVRLQTQPVHNPVYRGLVDCFVKTLKWEGIGGLYKGVGSPLVGQMFFRSTLFTSYYQINSMLLGPDRLRRGERLPSYEYFICGAYTGLVASFVEGPIDLFKTKMQIQIIRAKSGSPVEYRNVFHAGYVIARQHGIRGVYQGLSGALLRNIPNNGIAFGVYELFRDHFTAPGQSVDQISTIALMTAGGAAGVSYWLFTYPTDVIKSALQSDDSSKSKRKYRGLMDCIRTLYRDEGGVSRFYRGYVPCLMRTIPANVALFVTLEKCRGFLSKF